MFRAVSQLTVCASLLLLVFLPFRVAAEPDSRFVIGRTYPIAEPHFYEELRRRAAAVNWQDVFSKEKAQESLRNYKPGGLAQLPDAAESRTRWVDPTAAIPFDIPGPDGTVLYPRGYRFNVLDYITLTYRYIVINGSDPDHVAWAKSLAGLADPMVRVLTTDGRYGDIMEELQVPVFYLQKPLAARLGIEALPAIASQDGNRVKVVEIALNTGEPQ